MVELVIKEYRFGRIKIGDDVYIKDVIIHKGKVYANWWRKEGHNLVPEDLEIILKDPPKVLVIGTGYSGLMRVPEETIKFLEKKGIKTIVKKTAEACQTYNELFRKGKVSVVLHLTC
ncbi:MAG TPA: hypothetical protein EYP68_06665 [Candidatus Korarchaeota archaeon]|nr:hypothetical protein [Candidatus Korarchaeota archaeon]